ncbi:MAG: metal-binding protein [Gammaproteobacteria bacterium]|nr:metal-binding protein [Gammaproteobacteria bacterium]
MCNCAQLAAIVNGDDENNPLGEQEELEWEPDRWATLNRCPTCQQLWHIDIAKANQVGICMKVDSLEHWQQLDMTQTRVQMMVNNHGGLSFDLCRWKNCQDNCVKGLAFCPQHAYFEMDIKA